MGSYWVQVDSQQSSARLPLTAAPLECGEHGEPAPALRVPGAGRDRLRVYADPPRAVFHGSGETPLLRGQALREQALAAGDMIAWHGARIRIGQDVARLEPLAPEALPAPPSPSDDSVIWRRVQAGLLVELGLVERGTARRAQDAVLAGSFDPDAVAEQLLAARRAPPGDPRLAERSARLMRDLVMAPTQTGLRGLQRRVRRTTRSGVAGLLAQFVVVGVVACMLLVVLLLARAQWGLDVDAWLDRVIGLFARG